MTDSVPEQLTKSAKETSSQYTEQETVKEFTEYLANVLSVRKNEMVALVDNFDKDEESKDKEGE